MTEQEKKEQLAKIGEQMAPLQSKVNKLTATWEEQGKLNKLLNLYLTIESFPTIQTCPCCGQGMKED